MVWVMSGRSSGVVGIKGNKDVGFSMTAYDCNCFLVPAVDSVENGTVLDGCTIILSIRVLILYTLYSLLQIEPQPAMRRCTNDMLMLFNILNVAGFYITPYISYILLE